MAKPLHKILSTLTICAALTLSFANPITAGTEASKSYPYTGAVSGDSVRLRTGPSTGHAIAGVVTKADELIVLEEKDGWLKIRMPASEQCWISKQFVTLEGDQAKVTAKNVNLRIRPNTNNVPVGQVSTSTLTAVTEKGSVVEKDGYVRVVPPAEATLWIASQFVSFKAAASTASKNDTPIAAKSEPKRALTEEEKAAKELEEEREVFKQLELEVAARLERKGDKELAEMRVLMEQFSETTTQDTIRESAKTWVKKIDALDKALADAAKTEAARKAAAERAEKIRAERDAERKKVLDEVRALLKKPEAKAADTWLAKGFVADHNRKATIPASHQLVDANGNVLYYIRWDGGDLKGLWDKHVAISGTIKTYAGWEKPVIIISNAKEVPEERG
ncbi:MAG: SH3 domain-containing protein [Planctomycetes bacterium]|nr:SH3 domain-containing protein [Planctomycetota bacterium]